MTNTFLSTFDKRGEFDELLVKERALVWVYKVVHVEEICNMMFVIT